MPQSSGFDAFVSYAHADNDVHPGSSVPLGWVTALVANLNTGPNTLKKQLFVDHRLGPGDNFGSELLAQVERSPLLILLLSQNYVDSTWCGKELEHFIETHGAHREKPSDVYVVELFPYERLRNVPPCIERVRKQLIHAKFWYEQPGLAEPRVAGDPSPLDCGPIGRDHYWLVLGELRAKLDVRLRALRSSARQSAAGSLPSISAAQAPLVPVDRLGTVVLADTTDDLETQRNAVRIALEREGIVVLPEGDYVGLTPPEFEKAVTDDLKRADIFVQLLSPTPGRKLRGFDAPLPQLQFGHARGAKVPILQWCERLPGAGQIADKGHALLFETETLRATNLADFKTSHRGPARRQGKA